MMMERNVVFYGILPSKFVFFRNLTLNGPARNATHRVAGGRVQRTLRIEGREKGEANEAVIMIMSKSKIMREAGEGPAANE
jgi:hypothetical protein